MTDSKDKLLSVLLHTDSFFYNKYTIEGKLSSREEVASPMPSRLDDAQVDKKLICYSGLPFTHVPFSDFDPLKLKSYLHHVSYILDEKDWIFNYDKLKTQNIATVYAVPSSKVNKLTNKMPSLHCRHVSSLMIDYNNDLNQNGVFVYIRDKEVYITVINQLRFEYYNQVRVTTVEDLLYYLGLSYEQLALDRASFPLILSGDMHTDFDYYKQLKKYFALIKFQAKGASLSEVSSDFSAGFLDQLIGICES